MSVNEELEEHVHHAQDTFEKVVAGSMAIIAALLAIVSVLGQHYNTEQIMKQAQSSDQWAYFQAKDIRRYIAQSTQDMLAKTDAPAGLRYRKDSARYASEGAEIKKEAESLEQERDKMEGKAHHFHFGEVFLEIAIVFLALSILTKQKVLAFAGFASALFGTSWALLGFLR